ncbi:glycosyltransferase [Candidatus Bipolaricaulota bacterium]
MITLFWLFASLVLWHFIGYGGLLWLFAHNSRPYSIFKDDVLPTVSIVITAHNEERIIGARIGNCLALDYPRERLEIVVCSDASTDRTAEIARSFTGVKVVESDTRHRARAQSLGVENSVGEVICFTDAETVYDSKCIRRMVEPYSDPKVGGVVGQIHFSSSSESAVSGALTLYWRMENHLRDWQSRLGVLLKLSGAHMSMRRSLYQIPPRGVDIDQSAGPEIALRGFRVAWAPAAIAYDVLPMKSSDEWAGRRRFTVQALTALLHFRTLLNPFRHPFHAFHLLSYRVLRYAMPLCLLGCLGTSLALAGTSPLFAATAGLQVLFLALALCRWCGRFFRLKSRFINWPYSFCLIQAGILAGLVEFLAGRRIDVWEPIDRAKDESGS